MRGKLERVVRTAGYVALLVVIGVMVAGIAVMAVGIFRSWETDPWKLLLTLPVLALLAWGALEHYFGD